MIGFLVFLIILAIAAYVTYLLIDQVTIFDYQKGLLYRDGSFIKILEAGQYYFFAPRTEVDIYDTRRVLLTIPGQEILTKDKVNLKISLTGHYEVTDPVKAKSASQYYVSELYNDAQILLRDAVAAVTLEELLENRSRIDTQLLSEAKDKAATLGLELSALAIRDIMLPANLKRAFAGVLEAQKEAQKQLEVARGEQAVLRSLANSAKMYDGNPSLLQARLIQNLSEGNNTITFHANSKDEKQ